MLLLVNPSASGYSPGLEEAVVRELAGSVELEIVHTETPGDATALSRSAAREERCEVVAVLGGDGAVNEVANGLAGTSLPLACLPAGRTNVFCRALGLPGDAPRAAARLREVVSPAAGDGLGSGPRTRRVDLGTMNGRHFTFASGVGLSAVANRRLGTRGAAGRRLGGYVFVLEALTVATSYLRHPPRLEVEVDGHALPGVTVMAQNADPLTYLGRRPLPLCEGAGLSTGTISMAVLQEASTRALVALAPRVALGRGPAGFRSGRLESLPRLREVRVRSLDDRPLPVEVDGEYVGEVEAVTYGVAPGALTVVA